MRVRAFLLGVPEMPLADQRGRIAAILEQLRQGMTRRSQTLVAGARGVRQRRFDPVALLIAAGDEACTRGRTGDAVRVEVREPETLAREPVEVRRPDVRCAVAAKIGPTHVIRDDEHDVGLRRTSRLRWADGWPSAANSQRHEKHATHTIPQDHERKQSSASAPSFSWPHALSVFFGDFREPCATAVQPHCYDGVTSNQGDASCRSLVFGP